MHAAVNVRGDSATNQRPARLRLRISTSLDDATLRAETHLDAADLEFSARQERRTSTINPVSRSARIEERFSCQFDIAAAISLRDTVSLGELYVFVSFSCIFMRSEKVVFYKEPRGLL